MQFGIIGSGSWATALAKILADNQQKINWWIRNESTIAYLDQRKHNPHYVTDVHFDLSLLHMSNKIEEIVQQSDVLVIAVPSAFMLEVLEPLPKNIFEGKKIVSAIKGLLPGTNQLLNEYLKTNFDIKLENYFAVLGPCHAEEVAAEKLSYLTFSGTDTRTTTAIAKYFKTPYLNTIINRDIMGAQYAAVMKNIYALGAGIAHGLDYGDNFLSVYIANSANEMVRFVRAVRIDENNADLNYAASVYLGDLLVTCYSLYSRNRTFGNMIGKGYSVKTAKLELNMVAEGYNASRSVHLANESLHVHIPIASAIYKILWEQLPAAHGFKEIETQLV